MPMSSSRRKGAPVKSLPIRQALKKNKRAADQVKETADELEVVHAVLDTKVPDEAHEEDVGEAIARTKELGKQLDKSADILDEVNETLEKECQARDGPQRGAKRST